MTKLEYCLFVFVLAALVQGINLMVTLGGIHWAAQVNAIVNR